LIVRRKRELENDLKSELWELLCEDDYCDEQLEAIIFFILLALFIKISLVLEITIIGCSYFNIDDPL
jgi:hypothetical protein